MRVLDVILSAFLGLENAAAEKAHLARRHVLGLKVHSDVEQPVGGVAATSAKELSVRHCLYEALRIGTWKQQRNDAFKSSNFLGSTKVCMGLINA